MFTHTHSRAFLIRILITTFSLLIITFVIGLMGSAWAWLAPVSKAQPTAPEAIISSAIPFFLQESSGGERLEAEFITITPTGFEPANITRPAGRFLLAIEDRSGLSELTFRVSREGSNAQLLAPSRRKHRAWRDVINPPPGRYVLTEANHPEWRCLITIE